MMNNDSNHNDIHALKAIIAAQQQKIDYLENIIAQIPCNVYWKDLEGCYLGASNNVLQITGLKTLPDILGKKIHDVSEKKYADKIEEIDQDVMRSGKIKIIEEEWVNSKGEKSIYLSHKIPLFDHNSVIIGLLGVSFDITDRKKMELDLKKTKELAEQQSKLNHIYLENLVACLPENFYWVNVEGKVLRCNENQAKMFGLTPAEMIGKDISEVSNRLGWPSRLVDTVRENNIEVMRTKKTKIFEEMAIIEGKKSYYLSYKSPMLNEQGEVIGLFGITIDITERKRIEEELKAAKEQAEAANKAIKIFAESIAHELRTPLASLNGHIYGLEKYLPILLHGYQLAKAHHLPIRNIRNAHYKLLFKFIDSMESNLKNANAIIDMILFRANPDKLESNHLTLCSMKNCITLALQRYPLAPKERMLIQWNETEDFQFMGEELFTIHIIFNLLKNAFYYISKMNKGKIDIWLELKSDYNYFHFRDTSKGIAPDILPKIFNSYFSQTPHGTGVGLAFCKQVMQIFHGDIQCCSVEGEYTEFVLKFPNINKLNSDRAGLL